ncbi:LTA synthase family protein [Desulfovibrio sp. ZJ369]|uniref:LTA synthase family protein n=1 Tax=Desulfovibrio sp. ZJ369 TaxID=2709793 RepID=UPI0013E9AADD|nr:LTA synthase family protein [Desulfovibrio sp. ZJ369]
MIVDRAFLQVWATGLAGLLLSVAIERFLHPRPRLFRPVKAWLLHICLWSLCYAIFVILLGRPWCAFVAVSAILITLTIVSNAKYKNLREPFIAQDYDYFLDALRFPRLFLPFLGLKKFCLAALFFALALLGFWSEEPPASRFSLQSQLGGALLLLLSAATLLWRQRNQISLVAFDPKENLQALGLLPSLWLYALASRTLPHARSPFTAATAAATRPLPHLIAIQSESFFDARNLFAGIRSDVLQNFDALRMEAVCQGPLDVPAWGANTIRTEFSFLTGIAPQSLGVHRFNPYRAVLRGWPVDALPLFLKSLGYRTICIHPYWGNFYGRTCVLPRLGFDAFLDIGTFQKALRTSAYISDIEVARKLLALLKESADPLFIFAITMENHGPLQLDHIPDMEIEKLYSTLPDKIYRELDTYLYHLKNVDTMLSMLHTTLNKLSLPVSLCFYGDHVPIMPDVYKDLRDPDDVPYILWKNQCAHDITQQASYDSTILSTAQYLSVHDLALTWLLKNNIFIHY